MNGLLVNYQITQMEKFVLGGGLTLKIRWGLMREFPRLPNDEFSRNGELWVEPRDPQNN